MLEMMKKLRSLIRIGKIALVSPGKTQSLQIETTKGETLDNVKFIEPYGLTTFPPNGSETVVVNVGANGGNPVALVVGGRLFRLQDLKQGEVALYTDEGDKIHLKRGHEIAVKTTKFVIDADKIQMNGKVSISKTLDVEENIKSKAEIADKTGNMTAIRTVYNAHAHKDSANAPTTPPLTPME
nr:MAG TPA: baseplate assembly protein [Caudoviricetes sp.]